MPLPGSSRWKKIVNDINKNQTAMATTTKKPQPTLDNECVMNDSRIGTKEIQTGVGDQQLIDEDVDEIQPAGSLRTVKEKDRRKSSEIEEVSDQVPLSSVVANKTHTEVVGADEGTKIYKIVRSLSLSHLTVDTQNDFSVLKKSSSLPNLNDERYNFVDSSFHAFHRISADDSQDFIPESTNEEIFADISYGNVNEGRKRKHAAEPSSWKRNKAKQLRMRGDEYLGYRKPKGEKMQQDTVRSARELQETCKSKYCEKSKFRGCNRFTEEMRKQIHSHFWKNMSWDQRKIYVNGLVKSSETTQKTTKVSAAGDDDDDSRRQCTLSYFLPIKDNGNVQVCRTMFLNTLSLGSFTVQSWVKKSVCGITPDRQTLNESRQRAIKPRDERKVHCANTFLNNLPKLPSHYARKDTTKLFIEPTYHTLTDLFNAYKNYCMLNEEPQVCRFTFEKMFHEKNLSLYTLKKDMCDVCSSHKAGNLSEADFQIHTIKKNRARSEKEEDKKKSANGEYILLTLDLEAVKVCPYLTASALYFKTKLVCHNYTIYNLTSHHCTCYWFDETAADLTASTFTSFLLDYLERHCLTPEKKPIVIFSDGCTYQNRNVVLSNALLLFSQKNGVTITQKYLEPGHTQMECDSVHSAIERKLKNREIHLPSDYVSITKEARTPPYDVEHVNFDFVKNYADPDTWVYKSIRPGRKAGDPQVVDIRAIQYNPDLTLLVKLNFDDDWMEVPQRPRPLRQVSYAQLNASPLPIKGTKFNHLQQLKTVLPRDCHHFYDTLPYLQ